MKKKMKVWKIKVNVFAANHPVMELPGYAS